MTNGRILCIYVFIIITIIIIIVMVMIISVTNTTGMDGDDCYCSCAKPRGNPKKVLEELLPGTRVTVVQELSEEPNTS